MNAIQQIIGWMPALLQATGVTLALSVTSVLTALVLAVFLALGKISKNTVLRSVCGAYIFFFRGTPLLMQLFSSITRCRSSFRRSIFRAAFWPLGSRSR